MEALDEETKNKIMQMGMLHYGVERIIRILGIKDDQDFRKQFRITSSEVYQAYQAGKDKAQFSIDLQLLNKAKTGDPIALQSLKQMRADMIDDV